MIGLSTAAIAFAILQTGPLTLEEAIAVAERNSLAIKIAKNEAEKARQQLAQTQGQRGPKLNAQGQYTRFDEAPNSGFGSSPKQTTTVDFTLSYPVDLLGVGSRAARAGSWQVKAAEALVEAQRNDLRLDVTEAYLRVLQAEESVKIAEESVQRSQERLANIQKEFDQGIRAKVDVMRLETSLREAEGQLIAAQNGLGLAKSGLNLAMSRPIETEIDVQPLALRDPASADADDWVKEALENRPELQSLVSTQEALRLLREFEEGGLAPSLTAAIQHSRAIGERNSFARPFSTTGVLTVAWPIWDSGITRARVKEARQNEDRAKNQLEQTQLGISLEVRQALLTLANAKARIATAEKQVELARENFRLTSLRFDNGEGIPLEVADANTQLTSAQVALVNARYDYLTALAQLERALGTSASQAPTPNAKEEKTK